MSEYVIEKGISIPPKRCGGPAKYPFADMAIGDSFSVPWRKGLTNTISSAINLYCRKHEGPRFTARHIGDELRVWRIE